MHKRLYTFGYEGLSVELFLARLKSAYIETVIDVRANPISRKRGFSKRSLSAELEKGGLSYIHAPAMGCPKEVREEYKLNQDWAIYTEGFLAYLATQTASLDGLAKIAQASTCCLVCFEADHDRCHRKSVAQAAARREAFDVHHLTIQTVIPESAARSAA
jgi:uncharacterized protein (DUF488 family)